MTASPQIDALAERALSAQREWSISTPQLRADSLRAVADELLNHREKMEGLAGEETGLGGDRLSGELARTVAQLRLFSDVVIEGKFLDVRVDERDEHYELGSRPDIRRYLIPLGPVVNFAASNFPFAFSVVGGDTVSALAAGCSVIVKASPGHPRLSRLTARIARDALSGAGAPPDLVQLIEGQEAGIQMLGHPQIAAASFTGSTSVGLLLAEVARSRPIPIPFFGELGSVNPVFATEAALHARGAAIAAGFVASVSGSAGQLCTKPGFLLVPEGTPIAADIARHAERVPEARLLNPAIANGYLRRRASVLETAGIVALAPGSVRFDHSGNLWCTPTIVQVDSAMLVTHRESLLEESFGPLAIVVEMASDVEWTEVADAAFSGNLTGTIHLADAEDSVPLRSLIEWLTRHCGRVIFNGWPTGVSVTPAMQHGGPWPATTGGSGTSVGTAAIGRFLRPVALQDMPAQFLPPELRDDNPLSVAQSRSRAGESTYWGQKGRV